MSTSYDELHPIGTETKETYCQRLQDEGHEEAFIRKALATHYEMPVSEMAAFLRTLNLQGCATFSCLPRYILIARITRS